MLFSYNWLKDYIKGELPKPEKLAELLTLHSFEVVEIKKGGSDFILDIDVLPNRAHDCFCHLGIAREIAAILKRKSINFSSLKKEKLVIKKGKLKPIALKIKTTSLVPRYSAILIEGAKVKKSPRWLKEKLERVGIHSINNIVDLTNFVMLEMGQPLHAFDYDKVKNQTMALRMAKKGERIVTLDGIKRILDEGALVIEDRERIVDLVGIMGGKLSEIDWKTKNVFLQAGNFDRQSIYQTAKKLGLTTQASNIYSQGIDSNLTEIALERTYFLLKEFSEGKIVQLIDIYPQKILPKRIRPDLNYVKSLLGCFISKKEVKDILERLEFKVSEARPSILDVTSPTFRLDVALPEDLIEEIGRIYGYDKIPAIFPIAALIPPRRSDEIFWEDMTKNILKEAGFAEIYNYSFIGEKEFRIFNYLKKDLIELENPTNLEQKFLRPSLAPNLLKNVVKNQKFFNEIKIFELGKIFSAKGGPASGGQTSNKEKRMLTGVITGDAFYQAKGIIDLLLQKLGISDIWYDDYQATPEESKKSLWHPKKCAEIKTDHQEIGFLGEISQKILEEMEIPVKVVIFDINFEKLLKLASEEHEYRPISRFPAAIRDVAVLVPREVRVEEVLNKIERVGGLLVRDIDLFDIYEGEELPRGKKNLAFHIIYQAEDKTLSSKEVDKIHQKIIKTLEEDPEWQTRR